MPLPHDDVYMAIDRLLDVDMIYSLYRHIDLCMIKRLPIHVCIHTSIEHPGMAE